MVRAALCDRALGYFEGIPQEAILPNSLKTDEPEGVLRNGARWGTHTAAPLLLGRARFEDWLDWCLAALRTYLHDPLKNSRYHVPLEHSRYHVAHRFTWQRDRIGPVLVFSVTITVYS
jgi:hypothetical protein